MPAVRELSDVNDLLRLTVTLKQCSLIKIVSGLVWINPIRRIKPLKGPLWVL